MAGCSQVTGRLATTFQEPDLVPEFCKGQVNNKLPRWVYRYCASRLSPQHVKMFISLINGCGSVRLGNNSQCRGFHSGSLARKSLLQPYG